MSVVGWWTQVEVLEQPAPADLRAHLIDHHAMPAEVLDASDPDDWPSWHAAEHSTRHPAKREPMHSGHLRHTHPDHLPEDARP